MISFKEITERRILEKYERLPQDLKNILSSIDTSVAIENIASKYRLDEEKSAMLIQLVGMVILGFVSIDEMKEEMKETIDIGPQFIPLIADEIRQKIFSPVINSMQKVMTEKQTLRTEIINEKTITGLSFVELKELGTTGTDSDRREKIKNIIANMYNALQIEQKQIIRKVEALKDKRQRENSQISLPENLKWLLKAREIVISPAWEI